MRNHIEDRISAYMDNELTEQERQQVEEHLKQCPECSAMLNDLLEIKDEVFTEFHSIAAPQTLEAAVIQALGFRRRYWLLLPLVGPLLIFAFVFAFVGSFVFKFSSIGIKIFVHLIYAFGGALGSDPAIISGLVGFSLLLIIGSSFSLRLLLKTKAI